MLFIISWKKKLRLPLGLLTNGGITPHPPPILFLVRDKSIIFLLNATKTNMFKLLRYIHDMYEIKYTFRFMAKTSWGKSTNCRQIAYEKRLSISMVYLQFSMVKCVLLHLQASIECCPRVKISKFLKIAKIYRMS